MIRKTVILNCNNITTKIEEKYYNILNILNNSIITDIDGFKVSDSYKSYILLENITFVEKDIISIISYFTGSENIKHITINIGSDTYTSEHIISCNILCLNLLGLI